MKETGRRKVFDWFHPLVGRNFLVNKGAALLPKFPMLYKQVLKGLFWMNSFKVMEAKIVSDFLDLKGGEIICDIACGSGQMSVKMTKAGCSVYGIDMSERDVQNARLIGEKHNCRFCLATAGALPYKSNVFDKVVCICALEHFEHDELALQEMYRVLKIGGILVLTVDSFTYRGIKSSFQEFHRKSARVVQYYTDSQLAGKLKDAGFEVEASKYFISSPMPVFIFNLGRRMGWGIIPYLALFPVIYPLSVISDRFFSRNNEGYLLAMKAHKGE